MHQYDPTDRRLWDTGHIEEVITTTTAEFLNGVPTTPVPNINNIVDYAIGLDEGEGDDGRNQGRVREEVRG